VAREDATLLHQRLMAVGRRGRASVTRVRLVGPASAFGCEVELELTVVLDGVSYAVTHRQAVSGAALTGLRSGIELPVLVDPADPASLVIA
jgi:hypothetical protein